ncbi:MAG: hypothetical protein NTX93_06830 [Bacteroidia bacterium]|nr:hypothetical protein [Bacteroidia bacterium]
MKNYNIRIWQIILSFLFISLSSKAVAQISDADIDSFKIKNYREKLFIHTDRDIYITGEQVWLKVYKMNGLTYTPSDLSKVAYIELLDSTNNPVNQVKIWITGTSGSTGFRLSDTLSSGNYLIRAYTKWMLNYSEDLFFYKTITILNPFKNIDKLINHSKEQNTGSDFSSPAGVQAAERLINNENGSNLIIKVEPQKDKYLTREKVKIDISVTNMAGNPVETDLSISVVKPQLLNIDRMNPIYRLDNLHVMSYRDTIKNSTGTIPDHLPEIEGPLLSGIIKNKTTNEPLKNIDISLSFVGKTARCQFVKTNDKGEFNFVIREQNGFSELVIQPLSSEMSDSYVELSQPFCSTFNENKPDIFYLDSSKTESINNAVISMQINNIYEPFRQKGPTIPIHAIIGDFYGKPDRRIKMSDYIELKNIREIVKEILPEIMIIRRNKKYSFKIINSYPYQPFENQALILIDGVPVNGIENLLNVNSKDMERIDIINRRYFFSDYIFDGIVSFTTKKGDLSALESDNSVYKQVFEGYTPQYNFYSPDYGIDSLKESRIPDFRNTLYWKPDLKSTRDGKAAIEFFTSDESGVYTIIVEGISSAGETGFYSIPLLIK